MILNDLINNMNVVELVILVTMLFKMRNQIHKMECSLYKHISESCDKIKEDKNE